MILLVNPWIYDFAAYDLWIKPMGLLRIADQLIQEGYRVELLDCLDRSIERGAQRFREGRYGDGKYPWVEVAKPDIFKDIPRKYKRYGIAPSLFEEQLNTLSSPPEAILVTSLMTYWYPGVALAIRLVKERFPETPVILGGIYATLCTEHAEKESGADLIVKGQGLDIGRILRDKFRIFPSAKGEKRFPLALYPHLQYVPLLTSEGCPFHCTYCASWLLYPDYVRFRPEDVLEEIEYFFRERGIKNFAFYDDALLHDFEHHTGILLEGVLKKGIKVNFHTPNGLHARYLRNPERADLLVRSGFKTIRLSLETINPERQNLSGGKVNSEDILTALANFRKAGLLPETIGVYIMFGLDGQPLEEVYQTASFIHRLGARIYLSEFSPIPGTPEGERALNKLGERRPGFQQDPLLQNNSVYFYMSGQHSWEEIKRLRDWIQGLNNFHKRGCQTAKSNIIYR